MGRVYKWTGSLAVFALFAAVGAVSAQNEKTGEPNVIESINVSGEGGKLEIKLGLKQPLANPPAGFSLNNPPRIALDFPGTVNGLGRNAQDVNQGDLKNIRLGQSGGRTRIVLNLAKMMSYDTKLDGNTVTVTLQSGAATGAAAQEPVHFAEGTSGPAHAIRDVDFHRGRNGEAQVIILLSDNNTGIDLRQQGRIIVVDFLQTMLPPALERHYDVTDFGTLVDAFDMQTTAGVARLTIAPKGKWEQAAYQTDNKFIVEVKPVVEEQRGPTKGQYTGEKLSLNFQNIEVRSVLQVLADFTGLNMITSDTVTGNLTLRLKDVPWDQALDIILQAKGLDMRRTGNVIWIAPRDELATKEKLALEAQSQIADLEPLYTESFQLNYQKAADFQKLISGGTQKILSKRGSAVVDERTNTIFVQDIQSRLAQVRELVKKVDIAVKQVLIEARIVEATDTFSKNIGSRFGVNSVTAGLPNGNRAFVSGDIANAGFQTGQNLLQPIFLADTMNTNLGAPGIGGVNPGQFSLILMNQGLSKFLNLEISALQADGKGKVLSSPRVITADNEEATIEQGTQIPYQQATSSGATAVQFANATLSLKVKPQITPDENIIMKLEIHKDSVGQNTSAGPSIDTKKITTQVLVENGGTVGIGGIYEQTETSTITKVPLLGDIPILGWLFRQDLKVNNKDELLIFVTPRVVTEKVTVR